MRPELTVVTLHVLNLLNRSHRRGAEAFATDLAAALGRRGLYVRTVALTSAGHGQAHDVETISPGRTLRPRDLGRLWKLARAADVLVGHGGRTLVAGAICGLVARRPFVYRVIGEPTAWVDGRARRWWVSWAMSRAVAVICYHEGVLGDLEELGVSLGRVHVIPKGIDVRSYTPPDERRRLAARSTLHLGTGLGPVVLYLGALVPRKNVEQVIRSTAALPQATLLVVGDGEHRTALEALAGQCGVDARFFPSTEDPSPFLDAADLVALTSRTEGVPTVLLEAGLVGLGVVATAVGGVPTVIDDATGLIVELDDIPGTAAAIADVADRRQELGSRARQRVLERHDIDDVAGSWQDLLRRAAGGAPL